MTSDLPRVALFMPAVDRGGIASALSRIVDALAATGRLQLDVVTGTPEVPAAQELSRSARIVGLTSASFIPRLGPFRVEKTRMTISTFRGLVGYLRKEKPYALITFQGAVTAVAAAKAARFRGRLIVRESNTPSLALRFPNKYMTPFKRFVKGWSVRRADAVIAISRGAMDDIADFLGVPHGRIPVIHNPIVVPNDEAANGPAESPHAWLTPDRSVPAIVTVARLTPQKGVDTVVRAVAHIKRSRPIRLLVVGDGRSRRGLEQLAHELGVNNEVAFVGWVSNPSDYIRSADVFALGSRYEGLGNVLLEALALGSPIVSCDAPNGPRDILDDGNCGLLVPVDDHVAFAGAVVRYLDEPELVKTHRDNAGVHLRQFSPEQIAGRYLELLGISMS